MLAPVRATFRAVAQTVVGESASLSESEWRDVEVIVETALSARPARMQRQLVIFLRAISGLAVLRYGVRFARLDRARRTRLLETLQDSRSGLIRRGFWGLRTLVLMGFYARPAGAAAIGYRADPRGWEVRR